MGKNPKRRSGRKRKLRGLKPGIQDKDTTSSGRKLNRAQRRGNKGYNIQEAVGAEHPNIRAERTREFFERVKAVKAATFRKEEIRDVHLPVESIQIDDDEKTVTIRVPEEAQDMDLFSFVKGHFEENHPQGKVVEVKDEEGNITGLHWEKAEETTKPEPKLEPKPNRSLPPRPSKADLTAFIGQLGLEGEKQEELQELLKPIRGYDRSTKLVEWAKHRADYRCEVEGCTTELFTKPDGTRYVEVHHILTQREVTEDKWDVPENVTCLCPNHHREMHYGENREQLKESLKRLRAKEENRPSYGG